MITPRWVATRCQPIGMATSSTYLVKSLDHPNITGIVEIGGPDVLSYGDMMLRLRPPAGAPPADDPVPVLTPKLSSYWVNLVTTIPAHIARPLIEGLRNEVVVRHPQPAKAFAVTPVSYDQAVTLAIGRSNVRK